MTIKLKNIGILKQAEFSIGDLTVICGENNTAKTYAAYALYGFLKSWDDFVKFPISDEQIHNFLTEGLLRIDLVKYVNMADQVLTEACKLYTQQLDKIFAAPEDGFHNSELYLQTETINLHNRGVEGNWHIPPLINYVKEMKSEELIVNLVMEREEKVDPSSVKTRLRSIINDIIFSGSFPQPFICSSERTGAATFRTELSFARDRLLKEMSQVQKNRDPRELLFKGYQRYPSPIEDNVNFMRQLEYIAKGESFIAKEHPEILTDFADIVGGEYVVTQNDLLYYIPKGTRSKLTMVESSSSARALLDLSFYLNCIAEEDDLLMVDEPELSLHPENQRRIAKLFARLANIGVKVFITTHSDYIIKELNTLIMLNHDKPHLKRIAEENGYQDGELINADQVKVYVAEKTLLPLEEGQKRRKRGHTLVPAKIHPKFGIGVHSFDKTIDKMNQIQDDIVWGEE
ncbi:ATP-binding protein [Candidatus Poribacteria bacterium]|nr:ATP-binding protein [Candidatus Poribacteria bacterium]MYG05556.1 ATP-binding protein [Candidatus Poribacteria bacterium]MYK20799.1 ATP-binding protein [Candidatus Poribacteria bacterium]